jgi:hypothetical protein
MRPYEGYQLGGAMSKNLAPLHGTSESLCSGLGRLAGDHLLRRCPGYRHPITIEKATWIEEDRFEKIALDRLFRFSWVDGYGLPEKAGG